MAAANDLSLFVTNYIMNIGIRIQLELYFAIDQSFLLHHFPLLHQKRVTTDLGQVAY